MSNSGTLLAADSSRLNTNGLLFSGISPVKFLGKKQKRYFFMKPHIML